MRIAFTHNLQLSSAEEEAEFDTPETVAGISACLRKLGHQVDLANQSSGLSAIVRGSPGWTGGADPRREGLVMGDPR